MADALIGVQTQPQSLQGMRVGRNSVLNLSTGLLILLLNVIFVPLMIRSFGTELFGVLSVTWMVLANLAWLDFGLSRASARYASQELALGRPSQAAFWCWTAILTQALLGACGAILLFLVAPNLADLLKVQPEKRELIILALRLFAVAIPVDFSARSMSGILQAGQRFDWVNGLNLFSTLWTFGVYAVGILRGADFKMVIYGLFFLRLINLLGFYLGAVRVLPALKALPDIESYLKEYKSRVVTMIRFGWWISFASVLGPLLLYFDQWLVSILLGVSILPFYAVPMNLLGRLAILPGSLTSTMFPAISAMQARTEWSRIETYFIRAHRYVSIALIPPLFVLFTWAPEILRIWISPEFASQATVPLRILVFGFGIGLMSPISGALLDGIGKPDLLVKLYLVELPINLALVLILTRKFGIAGAAASYTLRATVETIALWTIVCRVAPVSWVRLLRTGLYRTSVILIGVAVTTYFIGRAGFPGYMTNVATIAILALYTLSVPVFLLDKSDRTFFRGLLAKR